MSMPLGYPPASEPLAEGATPAPEYYCDVPFQAASSTRHPGITVTTTTAAAMDPLLTSVFSGLLNFRTIDGTLIRRRPIATATIVAPGVNSIVSRSMTLQRLVPITNVYVMDVRSLATP